MILAAETYTENIIEIIRLVPDILDSMCQFK